MNEQENEILSKLENVINLAKEIYEADETLGAIMLANVKFSMSLYEAIAKGEFYGINEISEFYAKIQGITTHALLMKSYPPESVETPIDADEDLTAYIMRSADMYEPDTDAYEQSVKELVQDFKNTVAEVRSGS